jgi:hypothetical protein
MDIPPGLARLRRALLLHPADAQSWQALIDFIQSTGGGWLLSDLDGLFDDPIAAPQAVPRDHQAEVLEQGLEAHRAGDVEGLAKALGRLQGLDADGAWAHGLSGLLAEMGGASGYAAFARALERDPANAWFRYWTSVAALRRRDWIDFAYQALPLAGSDTLEHQVVVLAAVYHLIAIALVQLVPDLCRSNDLRVFDLVHPDTIAHNRNDLTAAVLRFLNKERRKMVRILMAYLHHSYPKSSVHWGQVHQLQELLRWRIPWLVEPQLSANLYAALQQQLEALPNRSPQHGDLHDLLPQRPGVVFGDEHITVWRDFRFHLVPSL